jgi:hypothetical protein
MKSSKYYIKSLIFYIRYRVVLCQLFISLDEKVGKIFAIFFTIAIDIKKDSFK